MIEKREYVPFDFRTLEREVTPEEKKEGMEDEADQINLKKIFKIPSKFTKYDKKKEKTFNMKGYRFFIPKAYSKNPDKPS